MAQRPTAGPAAPPEARRAATWSGSRSASARGASRRSASTPRAARRRSPPGRRSPPRSRASSCSTRRAIGPAEIDDELGGLSPQGRHAADLAADALHRALGAAVAADVQLTPAPRRDRRRTGPRRDERRGRQRGRGAPRARARRRRRRGDAEAVGGPASPTEREAAARPRRWSPPGALAHSLGIPHLTMDLEQALPRGRRRATSSPGTRPGGRPNPCVRCNGELRIDAMSALADATRRRRARDRPLRARRPRTATARCSRPRRTPPRTRPTCSPRWRRGALARLRFPLADLTKPEVRGIAAEAGLPVALASPRARTSASSSGEGKRSFLSRPRAASRSRAARSWTADGESSAAIAGHHHFTVGQRRGIGIAAPRAALRARDRRRGEPGRRRPAGAARERDRVQVRDAVLHRDGRGSTACACATTPRRSPAGSRRRTGPPPPGPGRHPELTLRLAEPANAVAPGQTASLMDGDAIVGHATIA